MEDQTRHSADGGWHSININNDGDSVKIDTQIGYVQHGHFYEVPKSATSAERFAKAVNLLNGNMPRKAEELIGGVVEEGLRSNDVAYYWALSVVSSRSFDTLGQEHFATLRTCISLVDREHPDGWVQALYVITRFIDCLIDQDRFGGLDDAQLDQVTREFDGLEGDRREEIRRHLDLIMTGALQDRLEVKFAAEVKKRQKDRDRKDRAWKFFEPDPCPPILVHWPEPRLSPAQRAAATTGAVLAGAGFTVAFTVAIAARPPLGLLFAAGVVVGGCLIARFGQPWLVRRERIAADALRHGENATVSRYSPARPRPVSDLDKQYKWGKSDKADNKRRRENRQLKLFRELASLWVDVRFADQNPDSANKRSEWRTDTRGLRAALADLLKRQYAHPDRTLSEVNWLITWRAKRARERWDNGTLRAHRDELRASGASGGYLFALGIATAAVGVICGAVGLFESDPWAGALLMSATAAGGVLISCSRADVHAVYRDLYLAETALIEAEHAQERNAFDEWEGKLADRPTDAEMARWLDYDKFFVKSMAMNTSNLLNRDIVTHAILTEELFPCRRARLLFGPPRYSRYRVIVLLLTEGGVEEVTSDLDFHNGMVSNQHSRSFNYDNIDWVEVKEAGIRFDSGRRTVVLLDEQPSGTHPVGAQSVGAPTEGGSLEDALDGKEPRPMARRMRGQLKDIKDLKDVDSLILAKAFRLALRGRAQMDVVVENFDHGFLDRLRENEQVLVELALDNAGVTGAVQMLKAVAREGREWLRLQRERRARQVMDFTKSLASSNALMWDAVGAAPPLQSHRRIIRGELEAREDHSRSAAET